MYAQYYPPKFLLPFTTATQFAIDLKYFMLIGHTKLHMNFRIALKFINVDLKRRDFHVYEVGISFDILFRTCYNMTTTYA